MEDYNHYNYPDVSADFVAPVPDENDNLGIFDEDDVEGSEEIIGTFEIIDDDNKIPEIEMFECAVCGKNKAFEELAVKVCAGEFICLDCHCQAIDYSVKEAYT